MERPSLVSDGGILKTSRRRRASVVLPDELGPERPTIKARSAAWSSDIARAVRGSSRSDNPRLG